MFAVALGPPLIVITDPGPVPEGSDDAGDRVPAPGSVVVVGPGTCTGGAAAVFWGITTPSWQPGGGEGPNGYG